MGTGFLNVICKNLQTSPRKPGFEPKLVHVRYVVVGLSLGHFSPSTSVLLCHCHPISAPYSSACTCCWYISTKKKVFRELGVGRWKESGFTPFIRACTRTKAVPLLRRLVAGIVLRCRACPREICCGESGRVTECPGTLVFLCQCNCSNAPYLSSL